MPLETMFELAMDSLVMEVSALPVYVPKSRFPGGDVKQSETRCRWVMILTLTVC